MDRITATPNYAVGNCSDLCGDLARYGDDSGAMTCERNACDECVILKAFQRLKEYEDTGLSPEECLSLARLTQEANPISPPTAMDWEKFWRNE